MSVRLATVAVFAGLAVLGCKGDGSSPAAVGSASQAAKLPSPPADVSLNGSGATFPNPLYQKWVAAYQASEKGVRINYQSVGSGAGIKAISDRTVDFGATDAPMTDDQLGKATGKILHIPTTLGAVVVTYNVKDVPDHLKITPDVLAGIFLGDVKKWNDPRITALNVGVKLPDQAIGVSWRSDGSGTTAVFTDYLCHVSTGFKDKVGSATSVKWPVGSGSKGNDGVTNQIKQTPGSIGYVELAYARQTKLPTMDLRNKAGKFVEASLEAIAAAAAGSLGKIPADMRISIVDAEGQAAYPIAAFTYILVYEDATDAAKAGALAKFLWWGIHDGQKLGGPLHYAALPSEVVVKAEVQLKLLKASGKPLLEGK